MGLFKRSCDFNDFMHDSKMKIYTNLSEMMINGGLSYLFWECGPTELQFGTWIEDHQGHKDQGH